MPGLSCKLAGLTALALSCLLLPPAAQERAPHEPTAEASPMRGYVFLTGITPESYLITSPEQLKTFVSTLPPVTPYKILPAPKNPDPLLTGFTVDFQSEVIAVAVGKNRTSRHPVYEGVSESRDGTRLVNFTLPAPTAEAYPFGWGVYTAVVLPRVSARTRIAVSTPKGRANR